MSENPYQDFKSWLCDGNPRSELSPDVVKAVYIVGALAMFAHFGEASLYLNRMYNNYDIYMKELQGKKLDFFKELKLIATRRKLSPWDLSYISLKKIKFEYPHLQERYPHLKKYEIDLLVRIMKDSKNKAFMDMVNDKKPTQRKLSQADEKLFGKKK